MEKKQILFRLSAKFDDTWKIDDYLNNGWRISRAFILDNYIDYILEKEYANEKT